MVARLLYGFRVSVWFGLALTAVGVVLGIVMGALQGYFGGRVDLGTQRLIEIWSAIPELYLLIIFASIFEPSLLLLLVLFALFGWIGLSDYVRAEFLRNRNLEFVKAARAMGLSNAQIIWRHVLPNSMTPVITFLPFRMSAAILSLTSLDFLGLGVPPRLPSLGDLLRQGKDNLDAWWISVPDLLLLVTDAAAADLHRRRAARRLRHAQVMSMTATAARGRQAVRQLRPVARRRPTCRSRSPPARSSRWSASPAPGKSVTALSVLRLVETATYEGAIRFDGEDLLQQERARRCAACAAATSR